MSTFSAFLTFLYLLSFKSASAGPQDAKVADLEKQVETLQKSLGEHQAQNSSPSSSDHEKLLEEKEKELASLQKVTSLLRDKVSSLSNSVSLSGTSLS